MVWLELAGAGSQPDIVSLALSVASETPAQPAHRVPLIGRLRMRAARAPIRRSESPSELPALQCKRRKLASIASKRAGRAGVPVRFRSR